jgi:hypothetical protein
VYDSGLVATRNGGEGVFWDYTDTNPQPINFAIFSAFQNLGTANKKRVHMARPYFITNGTVPDYALLARYDYDMQDLNSLTVPTATVNPNGWDVGLWDVAHWGPGIGTSGKQYGTAGMGSTVAIVLKGKSSASTTLVSIDVLIDQGWYL